VILLKPQLIILLNRLTRNEFRNAKNQPTKTKSIVPKDATKPWPWYKAWGNSLLKPDEDSAKELLTKGNISFRQAFIWILVVGVIYPLFYSIVFWIKSPFPINLNSIFDLVKNCFLAGLNTSIITLVTTGFIHILTKLFKSKGTFQNFFIIYITFTTPILLLFIIMAIIWQVSRIQIFLILGAILAFYCLILTTLAIKANYRFH
jgi:hypothetical protein